MLEQCRWKSVGGKLRWTSGTVLVAQCGGSVEQCWWNSGTVMVQQCRWNSDSGTVRWNSKTVFVEQCGRTVEQCWWNSGTVKVRQWNSDGGTV